MPEMEWDRIGFLIYRRDVSILINGLETNNLTKEEILDRLTETFMRTQNSSNMCNSPCKSLYFCKKTIGHKDHHEEDGLQWL